MITPPENLTRTQVERVEKQTLRWIVQALLDYSDEVWVEFRDSPDDADGVAEDVTEESRNRLAGFTLERRRLYGTVDYRRARYSVHDDLVTRQALFVDSKAEKSASASRMQINQTSMRVLFARGDGTVVDVPGQLEKVTSLADGSTYLTSTVLVHYHYTEKDGLRRLHGIKVAVVPNGLLETDYVVDAKNTIWRAGPDSPKRGEALRTRLSYDRLKAARPWGVQEISFSADGDPTFTWID